MSIDFNARLQIQSGPFYTKDYGPSKFLSKLETKLPPAENNKTKIFWIGKLAMLELQKWSFF